MPDSADNSGVRGPVASDFRHPDAGADGIPTVDTRHASLRYDGLRAARVRSVGSAFLRVRPYIVAPVAVVDAACLAWSDAPLVQRRTLAFGIGVMLAGFVAESWSVARRPVGERWLLGSLVATEIGLGFGALVSGGIASPMLPLLFAPAFIALAAFGRSRATRAALTIVLLTLSGLAALPALALFPAVLGAPRAAMTLASTVGLVTLAYVGAGGLVDAYAELGRTLETMRLATLAEASSRMRASEQVGAKVAHDIKNPLGAVKAILQLMRESTADERGGKRLDVALSEIARMDGVVRDYLAFARPLSELDEAPLALAELAADVIALLEVRAEARGVALQLTGAGGSLCGDARRLREALFNLVDNALAHTPAGGRVTIAVEETREQVRVTIDDTGAGIPESLVDSLVGPAAFTTTTHDGTGLGLVIARAAIQHHGGRLELARRPEGGTRVRLTLPLVIGGPLKEDS